MALSLRRNRGGRKAAADYSRPSHPHYRYWKKGYDAAKEAYTYHNATTLGAARATVSPQGLFASAAFTQGFNDTWKLVEGAIRAVRRGDSSDTAMRFNPRGRRRATPGRSKSGRFVRANRGTKARTTAPGYVTYGRNDRAPKPWFWITPTGAASYHASESAMKSAIRAYFGKAVRTRFSANASSEIGRRRNPAKGALARDIMSLVAKLHAAERDARHGVIGAAEEARKLRALVEAQGQRQARGLSRTPPRRKRKNGKKGATPAQKRARALFVARFARRNGRR